MAVSVALAAAGLASAAPSPKTDTVVVVNQMVFGASPAGVHVGDRVRWVNRDIFVHSVTADDGGFDLTLPVGGQVTLVATRAGAVAYHCRYHPGMKATVRILP